MSIVSDAEAVPFQQPEELEELEGAKASRQSLAAACARWSGPEARRVYLEQDELLVVDDALPAPLVATLMSAAESLRPRVVRKGVPGYKASGSVCYEDVRELVPQLDVFYKDPAFVAALSRVAGAKLLPCPERDLHSCALYYYTEPGDHIGWHFDSSLYRGARYTVLVGIVNRTELSKLECQLYKKVDDKPLTPLSVATHPGTLVFFNGDRLWHSVSKLEEGAERIVLTLEYVTDPSMSPLRRLVSDLKDRATYFGFRRRRPHPSREPR